MGKMVGLVLGLTALAIFTVGVVIVVGYVARFATKLWRRE